jgi:hypothetical protein
VATDIAPIRFPLLFGRTLRHSLSGSPVCLSASDADMGNLSEGSAFAHELAWSSDSA